MKTMVIDTSTQVLLLSFIEDDKIIFQKELVGKNNHSENLIKNIKLALEELHLEVKDFQRIIVGIGPGSYTGLRVSLTVAKTFAWTLDIPLYIVSSLDIIGSGYYQNDGKYLIKTRAKKGYVYCKLVEINNHHYQEIISDCFITENDFLSLVKDGYIIIDETNYRFNPLLLFNLQEVEDLILLEPNYLRGEM
ncbi:MAG TPA: tRNA (adenosine(37)-N6)-threonylcarbamoyltransferase complex dimerization subunit type 1 TsaB [Bacilli bacterium]